LKLKDKTTQDKRSRTFYEKPTHGQLHIFNRPYYFTNSNAFTHANDIMKILAQKNPRPNVVALFCDNGTVAPNNYLVFVALGRIWKTFSLDQLFAASFAPYNSKYNMIELAWGNMSQALAQVTLEPQADKVDDKKEAEVADCFCKAMNRLKEIWSQTKYGESLVKCENLLPKADEWPLDDYETVKKLLNDGDKHSRFHEYKKEIKFLFRHCVRRDYYLHFRKCQRIDCDHCKNSVKAPEAMKILKGLDSNVTIPRPT